MERAKETIEFKNVVLEKLNNSNLPQYTSKLIAKNNVTITVPSFKIDSIGNDEDDLNILIEVFNVITNYLVRKTVLDEHYGRANYIDTLGERSSWIYAEGEMI